MPRRGENIYKRKDGRWEARYIKNILPDGTKKYASVYAKSYKQVKEKQKQAEKLNTVFVSDVKSLCIEDIMLGWLECNQNKVKITTYSKYNSIVRKHINPNVGKIKISALTSNVFPVFSNQLLTQGLSKSTINDTLLVLNMGLSFAEKEYEINCPKASLYKIQKKEMRVLSLPEQKNLIKYLIKKGDIYSFGILLALFTGMRIGELCALTWEDISDNKIRICKTMQRINKSIEILPPKTQSSIRIIPIPRDLIAIIDRYKREDGYLLQREKEKFTEPRLLQIKFKKYTNECGIYDINFHALRHTFATRCIEAGFDIKTLSEILGHADVKTTLNKYVHSSMEQKIKNMDKLMLNCRI